MLDNQLRYLAAVLEKFRDWSWDPLVYTQLAGQALYSLLARDFAPLPARLRSLTTRLEAYPACSSRLAPISIPHECRPFMPKRLCGRTRACSVSSTNWSCRTSASWSPPSE